jgi:uncharacterized protein
MTDASVEHRRNRFGPLIERQDSRDFPFYDGYPVHVPIWKWALIVLACAAGFLTLSLVPTSSNVQSLLPRILFTAIPLAVFIILTRPFWKAIFHKPTGRDYLDMVIFWLLNLAVSSLVGLIVARVFGANPSSATDNVLEGGPVDIAAFYVGTGIQLLGEELFTILPFLALMYIFYTKTKMTRTTSILLAWFITALWFGAAHLPSYGWNFAQAFLIIGVARLVLTLAFIRTKSIVVSTGAHILNDWATFTALFIAMAVR